MKRDDAPVSGAGFSLSELEVVQNIFSAVHAIQRKPGKGVDDMTRDGVMKKNLDLHSEWMRYTFENPDVLDRIPKGAVLVCLWAF